MPQLPIREALCCTLLLGFFASASAEEVPYRRFDYDLLARINAASKARKAEDEVLAGQQWPSMELKPRTPQKTKSGPSEREKVAAARQTLRAHRLAREQAETAMMFKIANQVRSLQVRSLGVTSHKPAT
jgi:uncharacterized membrane protein YqiK